jgi:hypothetical protein
MAEMITSSRGSAVLVVSAGVSCATAVADKRRNTMLVAALA